MSESKLFGTSKTSYQDVGEAKIIVKHSAPVNYANPAGRTSVSKASILKAQQANVSVIHKAFEWCSCNGGTRSQRR
jgi:hypothetical protein